MLGKRVFEGVNDFSTTWLVLTRAAKLNEDDSFPVERDPFPTPVGVSKVA